MVYTKALREMRGGRIVAMSETIKTCKDCGADLSMHNVVEVFTLTEYMARL